MRPLGIVLRGRFLFATTYEMKNGFLLSLLQKYIHVYEYT